jgi:hypothetical protein
MQGHLVITDDATAIDDGGNTAVKAAAGSEDSGERVTGHGHASDGQSGEEERNLLQSKSLVHHNYLSVRRLDCSLPAAFS